MCFMSHFSSKIFKILLAEDDITYQKILVSFLSKQGYDVVCVATAKDFWHQFKKINPDLVILDIMLPDGNGFSIVHRIRVINEIIPVLIVTALDGSSDKEIALAAGADSFLSKSGTLSELALIIKRCIIRHNAIERRYLEIQHTTADCNVELSRVSWRLSKQSMSLTNSQGSSLSLNLMEFNLLQLFANIDSTVVSRQLLSEQLGKALSISNYDGALSTLICRLKKRWQDLTHQPLPLRSLRSKGYIFSEPLILSAVND